VVSSEVVVWVCDPETGWSLISIEQAHGSLGHHDQVVVNLVVPFNSIFNENVMSHDIVHHVLFNSQEV